MFFLNWGCFAGLHEVFKGIFFLFCIAVVSSRNGQFGTVGPWGPFGRLYNDAARRALKMRHLQATDWGRGRAIRARVDCFKAWEWEGGDQTCLVNDRV